MLQKYSLDKPQLGNIKPSDILAKAQSFPDQFSKLFDHANFPEYLYWDKLKYIIPSYGLQPEEGWFLIRQVRNLTASPTPIMSEQGSFFKWMRLRYTDEYLHKIDMYAGGQISTKSYSQHEKNQYIIHGIIEEAIASSQLEGAHTTRTAAKKMLLENRPPQNTSEQMILNNYKTIQNIESEYTKYNLSMEIIFAMHRQLTEGTELPKDEVGRLRTDKDNIVVEGPIGAERYITHVPPKESFLGPELERLIDFANDKDQADFINPIIKAIFIHFWFGYLHPFTDGNGRLARALFYWYLLKKGYWTMMYIPISKAIKKSPVQYAMAYIYAEQDNFDLTYFYDYNIRKIIQSLDEFKDYIEEKVHENRKLDEVFGKDMLLNDRQKRLIHYLLSDNRASATVSSHSQINEVSRQTAAKDLIGLEHKSLLSSKREGKFIRYYPTKDLGILRTKF